jgi:S-DNA-T family DNA segregation ATPase FtsK/SpoIIIE
MEKSNKITETELTANKNTKEVLLQSILTSDEFQNSSFDLPIVLGETSGNKNIITDLAKLPHLLVGGATGQEKSVFLHAIINSLLHKKRPGELKLLLIDTKDQDFSVYADLNNNFLAKQNNGEGEIISETKKVIETLNSLCLEMDDRYDMLNAAQVRNLKEYNEKFRNRLLNPVKGHRLMPYLVVVIDEFADLLAIAGKKVETPIAYLARIGQGVGIHLIIATQRTSENVIGAIKGYFPAKVAFRVTSIIDSRTILDAPGAEHLLGRGDMLFSQGNELMRIQAAFIDTPEIEKIVKYISEQTAVADTFTLPEISDIQFSSDIEKSDLDPFYEEASKWAKAKKQVSRDQIQRKFAVGHIRAGVILEQLKVNGVVK